MSFFNFSYKKMIIPISRVGGSAPHTPHLRLRLGGLRPPRPPHWRSALGLSPYGPFRYDFYSSQKSKTPMLFLAGELAQV